MKNEITFKCRMSKMGKKGKIIWIPLRFAKFFSEETYVDVKIRKLK